jgi:hypothetical protein
VTQQHAGTKGAIAETSTPNRRLAFSCGICSNSTTKQTLSRVASVAWDRDGDSQGSPAAFIGSPRTEIIFQTGMHSDNSKLEQWYIQEDCAVRF